MKSAYLQNAKSLKSSQIKKKSYYLHFSAEVCACIGAGEVAAETGPVDAAAAVEAGSAGGSG